LVPNGWHGFGSPIDDEVLKVETKYKVMTFRRALPAPFKL
jgi:hypothetical protein